jgi:hypothetical protein
VAGESPKVLVKRADVIPTFPQLRFVSQPSRTPEALVLMLSFLAVEKPSPRPQSRISFTPGPFFIVSSAPMD